MRRTKGSRSYGVSMVIVFSVCSGLLGVPLAQTIENTSAIVDSVGTKGQIDWTRGTIRAVGLGVSPAESINARHSRELARRAARVVAYRNLLEVVQGIHVSSHTLVKNYMVKDDEINTKVQGIVKGARVVNEEEFPDGSFEVTVEMGLNTDLPAALFQAPKERPQPLFPTADQSNSVITGSIREEVLPPHDDLTFTGLVVNAQGLNVQRAINPRILMEDGREVYSAKWVKQDVVEKRGIVAYVRGLAAAKTHKRVIDSPLEVKVLRLDGENKSDFVISDADAQTLHVVPEHLEFLEKAKVLVVLD